MKTKTKKIKGRRRIFIIGAYWILFVALLGIFASPIFRYSADTNSAAGTNTSQTNNEVGVGVSIPAPGGPTSVDNKTSYTYDQYICALYHWALNIGFGLTLLMFLYAGYRYMTSAGNDSVFTETKDVLTSAVIGFLLLLCIRLVLHFLNVPEPGKCFSEVINAAKMMT